MIISAPIPPTIPNVPFYSQLTDITSPSWKKVSCGITSLAMIIDYYKPKVSVNTLLGQGIALGAYKQNAGWTYAGLISVAKKHGLEGKTYDLGKSSSKIAFAEIQKQLKDGPVIASVHYKFEPTNPIPHLVVINGVSDGMVYYNDPAAKEGEKKISTVGFLAAWKKRFIVIRPIAEKKVVAVAPTNNL
jgi:ABC-type bacteriocin/lantibiotic exporter with double-glycine peptidase domain